MIVFDKNTGEKISYTVNGTKICFDDTLTIKCEKYQKDWPVHKDICMDTDGDLTMGTGAGLYYVAEIDIPAREYQEAEVVEGDVEVAPVALPLDMDKVTLTLWALENPVAANGETED